MTRKKQPKRTIPIVILLIYMGFLFLSRLPDTLTFSFLPSVKEWLEPVIQTTSILPGMELFRKKGAATDLKILNECVEVKVFDTNRNLVSSYKTKSICNPPIIRFFENAHETSLVRIFQDIDGLPKNPLNEARTESLINAVGRSFCGTQAQVLSRYRKTLNSYKNGEEVLAQNFLIQYDCASHIANLSKLTDHEFLNSWGPQWGN